MSAFWRPVKGPQFILNIRYKTAILIAVLVFSSVFSVLVSQKTVRALDVQLSLAYDIGITLAEDLSATATSMTISDGSRLPDSGIVIIDNEEIPYSLRSGELLSGLDRGSAGTDPAAHTAGAVVYVKSLTLSDQIIVPVEGEIPPDSPLGNATAPGPPIITEVRSRTSLIPGRSEQVQTIFTWQTNKPSTSRVYYEEGVSDNPIPLLATELNPDLVTNHVVITTALKPAKAYRFRVESIDIFQNVSLSEDYILLAPREQRTVFDLIIENFSQIFGFLNKLRE